MPSSKLAATSLAGGFGGVGPATPPPYPDVWIVVFLELDATAPLAGVEVEQIELRDAEGTVAAHAKAPWSLRSDARSVPDDARRRGDFSEVGTSPFDGRVAPGRAVRLRVHAPLDTRSDAMKSPPVRFRAKVVASGDPGVWVDGPLQGPWPTG